jgi:hypothetical protein
MHREFDLRLCNGLKWIDVKIMSQAGVSLRGDPSAVAEVRRGMILISAEGRQAGRVAGVVVSQGSRQALCLILSHLPEEAGYQPLPVAWVERVMGEAVILNASIERIRAMPAWHFSEYIW